MITCAEIFTDYMVLQQGKPVAIFGTGVVGEVVTVSIPERGIQRTVEVQPCGHWKALLPPMHAGTGVTLQVNDQIFREVAIGEVWLAGGQSNMEFMLKDAKNGGAELEQCKNAGVRYFQVPRNTVPGETYEKALAAASWQTASKETAGTWSAVAYLAAKELSEKLGVVVGVIGCNYGGSSVSCWLPKEDLESVAAGRAYLEDYEAVTHGKTDEEMIAEYAAYEAYHAAWTKRMEKCYQEDGNTPWEEIIRRCGENKYPGPMGIHNPLRPSGMFENMLKPLVPYTLAGVFYYQGENDDHRPEGYDTLLSMMIARWRKEFQQEALPVMLVQLPMFAYYDTPENGAWSVIREAQMRVSHTVKNVGIAVILDCGEMGNIHPTDKHRVGHRLALQALYHVYGEKNNDAFAPEFDYYQVEGDILTVYFRYAEEGLVWSGKPGGFLLAGRDGVYYPAQAVPDGNGVHLCCAEVPKPVHVRFQWVNYAEVTLFGKNGMPVAPFRTDAFPMPLTASPLCTFHKEEK